MEELGSLMEGLSASQHQEAMNVQIATSIANALIITRGIKDLKEAVSLFDEVWEQLGEDEDEEDEEDLEEDDEDEDEE